MNNIEVVYVSLRFSVSFFKEKAGSYSLLKQSLIKQYYTLLKKTVNLINFSVSYISYKHKKFRFLLICLFKNTENTAIKRKFYTKSRNLKLYFRNRVFRKLCGLKFFRN